MALIPENEHIPVRKAPADQAILGPVELVTESISGFLVAGLAGKFMRVGDCDLNPVSVCCGNARTFEVGFAVVFCTNGLHWLVARI